MILLLCGLSIAVKTTIAYAVKNKLEKESIYIGIIDADLYSGNISKNLGFSKENRCKNIRRLEVVAQLFCAQHIIPIITAITPYEIMRQEFSAA